MRRVRIELEVLYNASPSTGFGPPEDWDWGALLGEYGSTESPVAEARCLSVTDITPGGEPV